MAASRATGSADTPADIKGVFQLMDHRGFGKITLEAIFAFTDTLPVKIPAEKVTEIYRMFDVDKSGDIDEDEFRGFIRVLETLAGGMSPLVMVEHYSRTAWRRLFELVDADGGGTIGKDELRTLVDALQASLGLKKSGEDAVMMLKDVGTTELNFEQFFTLMRKLCAGKPITQILRGFEDALGRRRVAKAGAVSHFRLLAGDVAKGGRADELLSNPSFALSGTGALLSGSFAASTRSGGGGNGNASGGAGGTTRVCGDCARRDAVIEELRERVRCLEAAARAGSAPWDRPLSDSAEATGLLDPSPEAATAGEPSAAAFGRGDDGDGGAAVVEFERALGLLRDFPDAAPSVVAQLRGGRVAAAARIALAVADRDHFARDFAVAADRASKAAARFAAVFDGVVASARAMHALRARFLRLHAEHGAVFDAAGAAGAAAAEILADFSAAKGRVRALAADARFGLEDVLDARARLADAALAGAAFSTKPLTLLRAVRGLEDASGAAARAGARLLYHGCCDNLGLAETLMHRAVATGRADVSEAELGCVEALQEADAKAFGPAGAGSSDAWAALLVRLRRSVDAAACAVGSFDTQRRDRGVQTERSGGSGNVHAAALPGGGAAADGDVALRRGHASRVASTNSNGATDRGCSAGRSLGGASPPLVPPQKARKEPSSPKGILAAAVKSSPPRKRDIRLGVDATDARVDALIRRYLAQGAAVPENFGRLPRTNADLQGKRHVFLFGTRRIDVLPHEDALVVPVGGGFLLFDEFCRRRTDAEAVRATLLDASSGLLGPFDVGGSPSGRR